MPLIFEKKSFKIFLHICSLFWILS